MQTKSVVLTSTQNFVWHSMQEIIPFIVETWQATENEKNKIKVVDVDKEKFQDYFKDLLEASNIIITCFTPQLFRLAKYIRQELKLNVRFIIHLHNQATISCWPIRHWGDKDLIQTTDVFVSSCERDARCLKISYPEVSCAIIPFSYKHISKSSTAAVADKKEIPFIFIGRISSQKNLHTTLASLGQLKRNHPEVAWTFNIYGKEDRLGSPNMGIQEEGYQSFLEGICVKLEIQDRVFFRGHQSREHIDNILNSKRHIFLSPSLHSDENFGMAAFKCLLENHQVVLSDWGGHADFKKYFPDQAELVNVYKTAVGPFISPTENTAAMLKSTEKYREILSTDAPPYYYFENIIEKNKNLLKPSEAAPQKARISEVADLIYGRAINQKMSANPQIFDSYEDKRAHLFFAAYGMQHELKKHTKSEITEAAPWVELKESNVFIKDFHRGQQSVSRQQATDEWLYERGYIYRADKI